MQFIWLTGIWCKLLHLPVIIKSPHKMLKQKKNLKQWMKVNIFHMTFLSMCNKNYCLNEMRLLYVLIGLSPLLCSIWRWRCTSLMTRSNYHRTCFASLPVIKHPYQLLQRIIMKLNPKLLQLVWNAKSILSILYIYHIFASLCGEYHSREAFFEITLWKHLHRFNSLLLKWL